MEESQEKNTKIHYPSFPHTLFSRSSSAFGFVSRACLANSTTYPAAAVEGVETTIT